MNKAFVLIAFALFVALFSSVHAQAPTPPINFANTCSYFFGQGIATSFPWLGPNFNNYDFSLEIALLIVTMVFAVLAILYAIGYAFGVTRLLVFVKTEYLESFLNILIIVALFGGAAILTGGMIFISNLGNAVISAAGAAGPAQQIALGTSTASGYQDINGIYNSVCTTYMGDAISHLGGLTGLNAISYGYTIAAGFKIQLMPNGMGIILAPLSGITPYLLLIGFLTPLISGVIGIEIGVIFFMVIVYYLFPLLLFVGVLMRSFPWTRAAGGTLIALFIGFYVFFPALIYPFTAINYKCLQSTSCIPALYSPSASAITWNWGDGTTTSGLSSTHLYTTPGPFSVKMNVNDPTAGSGSDTYKGTLSATGTSTIPDTTAQLPSGSSFGFTGTVSGLTVGVQADAGLSSIVTSSDPFAQLQSLAGQISQASTQGEFLDIFDFYIFSIINATFQIFGIIISFVISYSLLEGFADLLGAPSLQARDMLKKVI